MFIKIIVDLLGIEDDFKPPKGTVLNVEQYKPARFNKAHNDCYMVSYRGRLIPIFAWECQLIEERSKNRRKKNMKIW